MNKLEAPLHRRPVGSQHRVPRTRTETAVELVRVEFEGARLERELAQTLRRSDLARRSLSLARTQADRLLGILARREDRQ